MSEKVFLSLLLLLNIACAVAGAWLGHRADLFVGAYPVFTIWFGILGFFAPLVAFDS